MRLSVILPYAGDVRATVERAVAWEQAGVDVLWVPEAYGFDAVTVLGFLAARTRRVGLGSAILPIYTRTPTLLAQTAAGLDALSGGRALLGIGASGPQVVEGWHGVAYDHPVGRTREVVELCRRAWRRETLRSEGHYRLPLPPERGTGLGRPLKMLTRPVRERIPIYVASLGPANVRMTAEVADGWLPALFLPEKAAQVWGEALAAGGAKRSGELDPLEVVGGGPFAIGSDLAAAREHARRWIALYVGGMGARGRNFYHDLVVRYGYPAEADRIQELYLAGRKAEAAAAVPAELLEAVCLIGPPGHVRERVAAYAAAGVTMLQLAPVGPDPLRELAAVRKLLP